MSYLTGKNVSLREVHKEDLDIFLRIRNDYNICKYFRTIKPLTSYNQEWYLNNIVNNDKHIVFTIVERSTMKVIGEVRASNIDQYNSAEIGIILDNSYYRKGYGSEALKLFLGFVFGRANINRVVALIADTNVSSIEFFKKNNFVYEGKLRQATYYDYEYHNILIYSILKEEF